MGGVSDEVSTLAARFRAAPNDRDESALRRLRMGIAEIWAGVDGGGDDAHCEALHRSELKTAYDAITASGLLDLPLHPDEEGPLDVWRKAVRAAAATPGARPRLGPLRAAALFLPAHELAPLPPLDAVPPWLRRDHLAYLLRPPEILLRPGEAERYFRFLEQTVGDLDRSLEHGAASPIAAMLEEDAVGRLNVIQAYFHEQNVRGLMRARGRLLERYLRRRGLEIDHVFAPRPDRRRLRVGFLCQVVCPHTESYFALAHLQGLDRSRIEVVLYVCASRDNPVERACRAHADRFVVLPAGLAEQTARIRRDDLDVLVVMNNVAAVTNPAALLAAHRLARTQVASMSSPVTTGLASCDAFLSAALNEPPDGQTHYTETLRLLPGSLNHYAFQDEPATLPAPTRRLLGVTEDHVVFFSAANFFKITPDLARAWGAILARVPASVLVLLPFNPNWSSHYGTGAFCRRLLDDLARSGVGPDRLRVVDPLPSRGDVIALMRLADVYLDSHPFAGACSMFDPLQVHVPPVVRRGQMARSRHGAAILHMMELNDLITTSEDEYVDLAVALGQDDGRREVLRERIGERLRARGNPVLDSADFGRHVTDALCSLAQERACAQAPARIARGDALRSDIRALAATLPEQKLRALTDFEVVRSILRPVLVDAVDPDDQPHMVAVGACYGELAALMLEEGWTADLYEPDTGCHERLTNLTRACGGTRARLHAAAVSDCPADSVRFFKAATNGLSGLTSSPYGATESVVEIRAVRLDQHLRSLDVARVDFLKIDAEGHDLKALASFDLKRFHPRFVLLEINNVFPDQSLPQVRSALRDARARGYRALIMRYEDEGTFARGIWNRYWLRDLLFDDVPDGTEPFFANVILYAEDDLPFLARLHDVLAAALRARKAA